MNKNKLITPKGIYHIKGRKKGPIFCVLAGIHGDEIFGIKIVEKILKDFNLDQKKSGKTYASNLINGELYIGFGNPAAIKKGTRSVIPNTDLNRSFQLSTLEKSANKDDSPATIRARELLPILSNTDILIDLHSTHTKSTPFICLGNTTKKHASIYKNIAVPYVLTDPDCILPKDIGLPELGTTDYAVNTQGDSSWNKEKYSINTGIGFAYESGCKKNMQRLNIIQSEIYQIMYETNLLIKKPKFLSKKNNTLAKKRLYKLTTIVRKKGKGKFKFKPGLEKGWINITKGDCIGEYTRTKKKILATHTGKLLFQKKNSDMTIGSSLCYMATQV